ncbi:MAG: polysaccharide pyruvyl transferase family protein [Lachnospiraceae bacterium]|nr:polysaccharide pyruvyl transferase family protein [Lachnospiraceae bacterium]
MGTNLAKMVICGATGINNSGDEAILDVLLHQLNMQYDISVICLDPNKASNYHPDISFISINNSSDCKQAITACDIFILGGGGLFQDETSIFNIIRWYSMLNMAIKADKHTMVYANSIGPLHYKLSRTLVRKILNQVDAITLRDTASCDLLMSIGVRAPMHVTADPVFSYTFYDSKLPDVATNLPNKYVAIAIRHWYDSIPFIPVKISNKLHLKNKHHDHYIRSLREIVSYTNQELHLPVVFLSFLSDRDLAVAKEVLNTQELLDSNIVIDGTHRQLLPREMFPIIQNAQYLIGMRLHSLIYAMDVSTPFIAIDYSSKVRGLLKDVQLEAYSIPVDELSVDTYKDAYQKMINNSVSIVRNMKFQVSRMQESESMNMVILINNVSKKA